MKMPRKEIYILIVSLAAVAAILVACSGGLSEEDVEERAMEMAEEMGSGSAMMPKRGKASGGERPWQGHLCQPERCAGVRLFGRIGQQCWF